MTDKNEFFRSATLRICGNLDIEHAMSSCMQIVRQHMPADRVFLQFFDPGVGAMRTIASATAVEGTRMNLLTPLSASAVKLLKEEPQQLTQAFVINEPEKTPVARDMLRAHGEDARSVSLIVMRILTEFQMIGGQTFGTLVLLTDSRGAYTEQHAELLSSLMLPFAVAMANALKHREVLRLKEILADDNRFLSRELQKQLGNEIIGQDFGLKNVMEMVRRVSPLDSPVLLFGETGVGKDIIASAIHSLSSRREGPFIAVNSGSMPETLIDSELFGHEKGAFTGAMSQKRGRFERAHKGTIFLDEIGELPPQVQVRMLRVLQNKEIERVGGTRTIPIDVRVIAATHRNLEEMVGSGQFREDLWFRLNVFPVRIPPLRDRTEDMAALVHHFIDRKSRQLGLPAPPPLAPGATECLTAYGWPGNIRELENVIERALILNCGEPLTFDPVLNQQPATCAAAPAQDEVLELDQVVAKHIRRVLSMTENKIHGPDGASELLGINASTLRNRMNKLGIAYKRRGK